MKIEKSTLLKSSEENQKSTNKNLAYENSEELEEEEQDEDNEETDDESSEGNDFNHKEEFFNLVNTPPKTSTIKNSKGNENPNFLNGNNFVGYAAAFLLLCLILSIIAFFVIKHNKSNENDK